MTKSEKFTLVVSVISVGIASISLCISWQTTQIAKFDRTFQLRSEVIKSSKTISSDWNDVMNELSRKKLKISKAGGNSASLEILSSLESSFEPMRKDAKTSHEQVSSHIFNLSDKELERKALKLLETKITMERSIIELEKKLKEIED